MPRPTADQLKHPKRVLFSDLKLQLWHHACKPRHTLVVMGDMNTDLYAKHRRGKDRGMLLDMMNEFKLVSCGQAAWSRAHVGFVTHGGDSVHADSHIDYILISQASATSVRRFGVHTNPNLCEDRGDRHAALFADIDVVAVPGVAKPQLSAKAQDRFQSAVKYSDKPRLARFRDFSTKVFSKRGLDVAMESLIGNIILDKDLQRRAERSGGGGRRCIGDRQTQSAKGLKEGVRKQTETWRSGLRTTARSASGAEHYLSIPKF